MPLPDLQARICSCGCGKVYIPKRSDQKYATQTCKMRAYRARKNKSWFDLLTDAERTSWADLRQSNDPLLVRGAFLVEIEGASNGLRAARRMLTQTLWLFGIQSGDWLLDDLWAHYPDGLKDN